MRGDEREWRAIEQVERSGLTWKQRRTPGGCEGGGKEE